MTAPACPARCRALLYRPLDGGGRAAVLDRCDHAAPRRNEGPSM